jgi:hypothetical protein
MPLATGVFGPIPNSPRENYAEEQSRSRPRRIFLVTLDDVQRATSGGVDSDNVTVSSGRSRRKRRGRSREQSFERAGRRMMETTRDGRSCKAFESGTVEGGRLDDSSTDRTLSIPVGLPRRCCLSLHTTPSTEQDAIPYIFRVARHARSPSDSDSWTSSLMTRTTILYWWW